MENSISLKGSKRELQFIISNVDVCPEADRISYREEDIIPIKNISNLLETIEYRCVYATNEIKSFISIEELLNYIKETEMSDRGFRSCYVLIRTLSDKYIYSIPLYEYVKILHSKKLPQHHY